jgi:hypothetical protein
MTAIEKNIVKKQRDGVFNLLLKKTGLTQKSLIEHAKSEFIIDNLDMITPTERKQFNMLHFG